MPKVIPAKQRLIQIRGTSGSGKSTIMGEVILQLGKTEARFVEGRKRPLYYEGQTALVLGHYEIQCGGCDTIGSVPAVFSVIKDVLSKGKHILCEGLLLSEDVNWVMSIADKLEPMILFLDTDGEECLRRVGIRQEEKGREAKDPARVRRKLLTRVGTINRARLRLEAQGIKCFSATTEDAADLILSWL